MFSLADTLVMRPLTVPRASEIVSVSAVVPSSGFLSPTSSALSYPDYAAVRDQAESFASLVAFRLIVASCMTYVLVVPTLLGVTLLAAYFPARRAARIDPLRALRQD